MTLLISLCAAFWGFAQLARGMNRHRKQLELAAPPASNRYRQKLLAYGLLSLSLIAATHGQYVAIGATMWLGGLTLSAFVLVSLLSYQPRLTKTLTQLPLGLSILLLLTIMEIR